MTQWSSLPARGRIFISLVVTAAVPLLLHAFNIIVQQYAVAGQISIPALLLTAIIFITAPIFIFLPSVRSLVTIGDAFVISICMLTDTSTAVLVNAIYVSYITLLLKRKHNTPTHRIIFNIAMAVVNASLYGSVYHLLNPQNSHSLKDVLIPTFGLAVTFFLSNSIFVAAAISLSSEAKFLDVCINFLPLSLEFLVSACAGASIQLFRGADEYAPIIVAPFVAVVWGLNKINHAKAIDAKRHLKEQEELYLRTVESLALAVDAKDQVTYGHIHRVRAYAMTLARLCGVTDKRELMAIETGSLLHDIGKLAVEDYILNKPGPLSRQEYEKMKVHTSAGDEILRQIQFPFPVANYVRFHHERWNGQGYPDGLKEEEIPLGARMLAVADAFDAMRSSRPYKLSIDLQEVLTRLKADAGTFYDPNLVDIFIAHIQELEAAAEEAAKNITELSLRKYFEKIDHQEPYGDPHILTSKALQSSAVELIQLAEFCASHGKHLQLSEILQILVQRIQRLVPFSTCAFYLDSGKDVMKPAYVAGKHSAEFNQLSISLGKGISGWVAAYRQPMLNAKPALEFQGKGGDFSSLADALVVPLTLKEFCLGTISLYSETRPTYTRTHQELLQTIACLVAPMLEEAHDQDRDDAASGYLDPITRTYSSAYLSVAGAGLVAAAEQNKAPLCLLNLEVRNLRQIANLYGPSSAESLMGKIADAFRLDLRETDVLVRFGSQGFVALLPGMRQDQAQRWAQRLQQRTRSIAILSGPGQGAFASCQVEVASFPQDGSDIYSLIGSAQKSMTLQTRPRDASTEESPASVVGFPPRN